MNANNGRGRFLEFLLLDPVDRVLATAPTEDEEISEEEEQAVARSKEWFRHNQGTSFEEVVADLGFTMEQIRCIVGPVVNRRRIGNPPEADS